MFMYIMSNPVDPSQYLKSQLIEMASKYGLSKSGTKEQLAQRINQHLGGEVPHKLATQALELVMTEYNITDANQLTDLSPEEFEVLIDKIPLHNKSTTVKQVIKDIKGSENRIKAFIIEMALKFCRCAEGVKSGSPYGVCISRVFHPYGLTVSKPRCNPAKLLPKTGAKKVLFKR